MVKMPADGTQCEKDGSKCTKHNKRGLDIPAHGAIELQAIP